MSDNIPNTHLQLRIGDRYLHVASSEPCTLRFIGHLPSTSDASATWLGVEWDNASRGKHSGTHQGVSYFSTKQEGAGSFIKLPDAGSSKGKGKDVLRRGVKLWDAILDRYLPEEEEDGQPLTLGSSNGVIKVEMPRLERIKLGVADLRRMKEIGLERRWVSELGNGPEGIVLESLRILDISYNLITTWQDLAEICSTLPALTVLVISHSRIRSPSPEISALLQDNSFAQLEQLHLTNSLLSWSEILALSPLFPNLHALDVARNPLILSDLPSDSAGDAWSGIRYLDVSDCGITVWEDVVNALGGLRSLETINLSRNAFTTITLPSLSTSTTTTTSSSSASTFKNLHSLIIQQCSVESYLSLEHLNDWLGRRFTNLRMSLVDKPREGGFAFGEREDRALVIACLEGLDELNGSTVSKKERADAERYYVSRMTHRDAEQRTNRWAHLCGSSERSLGSAAPPNGPGALRSRMIDLEIVPDDYLSQPSFTLSLLPSSPIRLLRTKITRKLALPITAELKLSAGCSSGDLDRRELDLNDERQTVDELGLAGGDSINVGVY